MAINAHPSYSYSPKLLYSFERQLLAYFYVFVVGTDILTTYFGITVYGFKETIPWTGFLIREYGWYATVLRELLLGFFLLMLFRFYPNSTFKYFRWAAWIIGIIYFAFTTVNNTILIIGAS